MHVCYADTDALLPDLSTGWRRAANLRATTAAAQVPQADVVQRHRTVVVGLAVGEQESRVGRGVGGSEEGESALRRALEER